MKTIRRLIFGEVMVAVMLVTFGFTALFLFFDFVSELQAVGRLKLGGYQSPQAFLYVALMAPSHIYELFPITVLIGTIFVMARFAGSSEFTILRTSGLGPWRALRILLVLGLCFVVFTFAIGDYIAPLADRTATLLKSQFQGQLTVGKTGAWLKERQAYSSYAVNVGALASDTSMTNIRIFEFDNQGAMVSVTTSQRGSFGEDESWLLADVERTEFSGPDRQMPKAEKVAMDSFRWPTQISAEMVAAAVLRPDRMSTLDLFNYVRHLKANGQSAQKYEIQFWKKVFYPLSCLVMVVLALPVAYFHFRSGAIA